METKLNLYQKLVEIRRCAPYLKKDAKGFNFVYVQESTVLGVISDAMNEHGVILYQEITGLENVPMTDKTGKEVTGVRATFIYTWINADNPSETLKCTHMLQDTKADVMGCGGLMTYSMRYFLLKFLNVPTDKLDPDAFDNSMERIKPEQEPKKLSKPQIAHLINAAEHEDVLNWILGKYNVVDTSELLEVHFKDAIALAKKAAQKRKQSLETQNENS